MLSWLLVCVLWAAELGVLSADSGVYVSVSLCRSADCSERGGGEGVFGKGLSRKVELDIR